MPMNVQAVIDDLEGHERALKLRAESGERLSVLLPKLGLVSERRLDSRPPWLGPPRGAAKVSGVHKTPAGP